MLEKFLPVISDTEPETEEEEQPSAVSSPAPVMINMISILIGIMLVD